MKTKLALAAILAPLLAIAADDVIHFGSQWNDANKGGFTSIAPIISADGYDAAELTFQYQQVPSVENRKPLFCIRKSETAKAVQCFYVKLTDMQGNVLAMVVVPKK